MTLDEIYRPITADLDRVHRLLATQIEEAVESGRGGAHDLFTKKAINYLLTQPGKHLRPALVLFAAKALDASIDESFIRMAAVIELIHSASLVHDDIIDEAEKRRTLTAVHRKYGIKIAILIGDVLFTQAFSIVSSLPDTPNDVKVRLFTILSDLTKRMCYGEIFEQKVLAGSGSVTEEDYIRILEFKTALLMSTAARSGAILAGADQTQEKALASFGLNFGYAYQLVDDYKDEDGVFTGDLDLVTMAKRYVQDTKSDLSGFDATESVQSMIRLAEFILP